MNKKWVLFVGYYALILCILLNWVCEMHLERWGINLIGEDLVNRLLILIPISLCVSMCAAMVRQDAVEASIVPTFSCSIAAAYGILVLILYGNKMEMERWMLYALLFGGAFALECVMGTLCVKDFGADLVFSYGIMAAFSDLLAWLEVDFASWEAFVLSFYFGFVQIMLATYRHGSKKPKKE